MKHDKNCVMPRVFLTGITGFLGSEIAKTLVAKGHYVIATYRRASSRERCQSIEDHIHWIVQDTDNQWCASAIDLKPDAIIHAAWIGVTFESRNSWTAQIENMKYISTLLEIAKRASVKKVIGLGSQGEYGFINGIVGEDHELKPKDAYGNVKVLASDLVKRFCEIYQLDWYWLRLFSFYGSGESDQWLIPSTVKKMLTGTEMDFTAGEQKYAYLYAGDLGIAIHRILMTDSYSGVYNISSRNTVSIRELLEKIRFVVNPLFKCNFGKLSYREHQSMQVQGNSEKFIGTFGEFEISNFDEMLEATIIHLKDKYIKHATNESF